MSNKSDIGGTGSVGESGTWVKGDLITETQAYHDVAGDGSVTLPPFEAVLWAKYGLFVPGVVSQPTILADTLGFILVDSSGAAIIV